MQQYDQIKLNHDSKEEQHENEVEWKKTAIKQYQAMAQGFKDEHHENIMLEKELRKLEEQRVAQAKQLQAAILKQQRTERMLEDLKKDIKRLINEKEELQHDKTNYESESIEKGESLLGLEREVNTLREMGR